MLSPLAKPPYFAVIFTSIRTEGDHGYQATAARMDELAKEQPGYLGIESAREEIGITVSYWRDLDSILNWKNQVEHLLAQQNGREQWYHAYSVRICRVEREYGFTR